MSVLIRPIIDYQGPLFQGLSQVVGHIGYEKAVSLWQAGAVGWLLLLAGCTLTVRRPWLFTGLLLTGLLLLRLPGLGLVEQNVDESQWVVSAATLVANPRFWLSVDGTTSGPLNVWPPALLYYLGLSLDYTTLRLWGLLAYSLPTIYLLLATFRRCLDERPARLAILPAAVCLALTTDPDGVAFNSEQLPMLLLALAGYLCCRLVSAPKPVAGSQVGLLLALGIVLGCVPYTKLQATPIGLVIAGWVMGAAITDKSNGRVKRIGVLVAGGLLPTGLIGVYLLLTGLTDYAFRSYVLTNLAYAQEGSWGAGTVSWFDRLLIRLPQVYGSMPSTGWFWITALLLVPLAGLIRLVSPRKSNLNTYVPYAPAFVISVCAVSLYATLQPGNPFPHYQWLSFVPASWLMALLIRSVSDGQTRSRKWLIGVYLLGSLVYPGWLAISRPNPAIRQLSAGHWHSPTWAVAQAIRPYARANESMVVWGWANSLHVETGLLMGSRFIPLYFPVVPGPQQAYFLTVYEADLRTNRPAVIVDAVDLHRGGAYDRYPIRQYPAIQSILNNRYRLAARVEGAKIYVRR